MPLLAGEHLFGALTVKANRTNAFDSEEVELLNSMAGNLAQALQTIAYDAELRNSRADLEMRERQYQAMLASAIDGFWIIDLEGRILDCNQACCLALGYARDELLKLYVSDVTDKMTREEFLVRIQRIMELGHERFESVRRCRDGRLMDVEVSANYIPIMGGRVYEFLRDITERKRAEEALRASENKYRYIIDNTHDVIFQIDLHGNYIFCNAAAEKLTGYPMADLLRMNMFQLVSPEHQKMIKERFQARLAGDVEEKAYEFALFHKDGHRVWVELTTTAVLTKDGSLAAIQGMARDITTRKQAEESQARLATVVEQAMETIVITDVDGTIIYVNPAFEKITGYTRSEALGLNPRLLQSGKQDAAFYRKMWAMLTAGRVWSGHFINKRKDGTLYEEEATISPVFGAAGKIINYVAVKRDVTREKMLEAQNRQAAKMEAVGRLAGGVAHDFNNQLQIILGCSEMILENLAPDHPFRADHQEIRDAAHHSANLTRQLLAFSRQQTISPVILDLNTAIAHSLKMIGRLVGENIRVNFSVSPDGWRVLLDPTQLDQILANLAVNARDAIADAGYIFVTVANCMLLEADCQGRFDFVTPGDYVMLSFRDTGVGMTPEIQAHIFEPFFTTKGEGKGTGLGLATVYGIVKQNNGAITVQSAPGQGATFSIYLPRASAAASAAVEELEERMPTGTETILLVEDEEVVLNLVQRTLARQGYNLLTAVTPGLALQLCAQHQETIHLLLTDVVMPDMSGRELADRIHNLRPDICILFMSGYPADIMEQHGHLSAGLQVLQKPFAAAALAQRVRAVLDAPSTDIPRKVSTR